MKTTVIAALLTSLCVAGCSNSNKVSKAIGNIVRVQNSQELRLSEVTEFEWDHVYFFGPYMPRQKVCETLGVQVKYCERFVPYESQDDGLMSMAFVSGTRVVHYELHSRWNGDFTPIPRTQPISSEKAVFQVTPEGVAANGTTWLKLVLK